MGVLRGPEDLLLLRDQSGPGASAGGTLLLHLEAEWAWGDSTNRVSVPTEHTHSVNTHSHTPRLMPQQERKIEGGYYLHSWHCVCIKEADILSLHENSLTLSAREWRRCRLLCVSVYVCMCYFASIHYLFVEIIILISEFSFTLEKLENDDDNLTFFVVCARDGWIDTAISILWYQQAFHLELMLDSSWSNIR